MRLSVFSISAVLASLAISPAASVFVQSNLVSDIPGLAAHTDANLKNPWGVSFSATSPFWVSDAVTQVATLYTGSGTPQALVVSIPAPVPTGQVFNGTTGFEVAPGDPARFIFATVTGTISGWNPMADPTHAILKVNNGATSAYTGLAIGSNGSGNFLYAANFRANRIDVFDSNFSATTLAGSFVDPTLPAGFAPFNIENSSGKLYVTYAKVGPNGRDLPGPGNGFVSVFDTNGNFLQRLISNGPLNSPWGIAIAPSSFGDFSNDLLVGNFGLGDMNAFNPVTGAFLDTLRDASGNPIINDHLWALKVRSTGPEVNPNAVYFTAGIHNEADGLFGSIQPAPEPGTLTMAALCLVLVAARRFRLV